MGSPHWRLPREAAEKAEHVSLLSEIFALEGFILAMMAKHDEARARVNIFFFATCFK